MSRSSLLVSCFIVWHLTAICLAALPPPADLESVHSERWSSDDTLSRLVRPWLDDIQPTFEGSVMALRASLEPLRRLTDLYVSKLAFSQTWRMFAQPPEGNKWLVIRVASRLPDGTRDVHNTLGLPGTGLYGWRFAAAYGPGFKDKALANALDAFLRTKRTFPSEPDDGLTRFGPDILRPISRYYAGQRRWELPPDATLERIEIWYGYQLISARGDSDVPRVDLDRCYARLPDGAKRHTSVRLDDTLWVLIRVDAPPVF